MKKKSSHLSLRLACLDVGVEIEASGLHCASALCQIGAQTVEIALRRGLHLAERASECDHRAPQTEQLGVLLAKVVVERL
jgi:hypothetical protein